IKIPVAVSAFAEEIYQAPKSWAEKAYAKLIFYNKHDKGTHFAAWEQPELFVGDMRAAFKSLRLTARGVDLNQLKTLLPETVEWKSFAAFPPSVRLAVIAGRPSEAELFMIRIKVPSDVKLMPHRHSEDRIYTVVAGVFYIGVGDEFDADRLQAYAPGAVIFLPSNT